MNEIVAIIFRLINFAIVAAASVYLFKKYALSMIQDQIREKQKKMHDLEAELEHNMREQKNLENIGVSNQKQFDYLQQRLNRWKGSFNERLIKHENEKKIIQSSLETKAVIRNNFIKNQYIQQQVMPKVLLKARATLQEQFESEKSGSEYLNKIISFLEKRSS